jgi:hypothetical protein
MSANGPAIDTEPAGHSDGGLLVKHVLTVRDLGRPDGR